MLKTNYKLWMLLVVSVTLIVGCESFQELTNKDRTPQQRINDVKILVVAANKQIAADVIAGYMAPDEGQGHLEKTRLVQESLKQLDAVIDLTSPDVERRIAALETQMLNMRELIAKEAAAERAKKESK